MSPATIRPLEHAARSEQARSPLTDRIDQNARPRGVKLQASVRARFGALLVVLRQFVGRAFRQSPLFLAIVLVSAAAVGPAIVQIAVPVDDCCERDDAEHLPGLRTQDLEDASLRAPAFHQAGDIDDCCDDGCACCARGLAPVVLSPIRLSVPEVRFDSVDTHALPHDVVTLEHRQLPDRPPMG